MNRFSSLLCAFSMSLAIASRIAAGSPGHDHSHDDTPQVATGPASPRFEAHSDLFEVVGVLSDSELSVFVDRYDDNAPVLKAEVELESGATKAVGQFYEDHGDYSFTAASFKKPGNHAITLTVTTGDDMDILAGNLVVPETSVSHVHPPSRIRQLGLWTLGLVLSVAIIWTARRVLKRHAAGGQE